MQQDSGTGRILPKLSDERRQAVILAYRSGKSQVEVADEFSIHQTSVLYILRRAKEPIRPYHKTSKAQSRQIAQDYANGKTSTVEFLRQIWAAQGLAAASLGTLGLIAPGIAPGGGLTTPDPVSLADTLARLATSGIGHAALEASSHGLDQFRLDGIVPAAAAFTNLTRDHLDYHGGIGAYRAAKLRLFGELLPPGAPAIAADTLDAPTLAALKRIAARRRLRFATVGANGTAIRLLSATPRSRAMSRRSHRPALRAPRSPQWSVTACSVARSPP